MSDTPISRNTREEDDLFDFGDHLARGDAPAPSDGLEATAARIQQVLRGSAPAQQGIPAHLKATIWEEIMQSTTTTAAPPAPTNPWGAMPTKRAPRPRAFARDPNRVPYRRLMWSGADIALALLVILAAFATWRILGDSGSSGDGPPTISAVAQYPATPESGDAPAVIASPGATPAPLTDCDLSGDIPIIPDLAEDKSPVTTPSLYVVRDARTALDNPRGELKLGCAGEAGVTLAENVYSVGQGPWPGTASVWILPPGTDDLASVRPAYVNLVTGAMITFGAYTDETRVSYAPVTGSPWVIGPSADDPAALAIADLRTMEVRPLSEVVGVSVPAGSIPLVSQPANDGTIAIGFAHPYSEESAGSTLITDLKTPGDLLLLGTSFADTRWISVPDSLPRISAIALSTDGSHAAVTSLGEGQVVAESYRYGLIDVSTGALVATSADIPNIGEPFFTWVQDGHAVAYLAGSSLQTLSIDGAGQPTTVFTADSQLSGLQNTWDPNVVVAATSIEHGSDAPADPAAKDMVYAVNVATGAVHEFAGIDASAMVGWITDAGALVMYQWDDARPEIVTYQVFDPVTGAQIGEIADAPAAQPAPRTLPTLGPDSSAVSADGRVEAIALGTQQIYAFTAGANGLTMRRVASPDGLLAEVFLTANVSLSPDGTQLSLNGEEDEGRTRYLISLADPKAQWLGIENTIPGERGRGLITFAEGTGA